MNPSIVKRCLVGAVLAIAATLPGFQQLHTSVEGLKLIADYEGCRLQPYQCSAGVWTDGIGNTSGVIPGKTITERQAAEGLISNVLRVERARLYAEAEQTSALLRQRQHRIEELKRENEDLRRWADTPLPADIIRLRERPALTGGAAYRQWLSASDAVSAGAGSAAH